ncbi:MAG: nucleotidyl transferase AbiEii/AbiGii toxin family protein [Pelolinea sp.]|nr:nucleotidyl transferase AbiEii/AbiGii toxin family protein [Pelolinea sp.]
MLDFQQIKEAYPKYLHVFERSLFREYLQYKILQALFESKLARKITFIGGTTLRIVYGNNRFSEDIDLDNFGLSWNEFDLITQRVQHQLELEGFEAALTKVEKGACHCRIKFPGLLFEQGLSNIQQQNLLIKLDTIAQGYEYQPDIKIINKFDVFSEIRVAPLSILLSQKIFASINRKHPKGRDFYDITYLFSKTNPDHGFIKLKMGIDTSEQLRFEYLERIKNFDFKQLAEDVAPFLLSQDQKKRVEKFQDFWKQVDLKLVKK